MPFVPDAQFETKDKMNDIRQRILDKKEKAMIAERAKEERNSGKPTIDNAKLIKEVFKLTSGKNKEKEPKPLSLKNLKDAMKMDEFVEGVKQQEVEELLQNEEIIEVKNEAINVLSLTHTNPVKRQLFANRLHQSTTINNYVNNNVLLAMFSRANENLKFGVVYGMKYLQTNSDYERLLMMQKLQQEQLLKDKLKEEKKEEVKEKVKEETKEEVKEESSEDEEEEE